MFPHFIATLIAFDVKSGIVSMLLGQVQFFFQQGTTIALDWLSLFRIDGRWLLGFSPLHRFNLIGCLKIVIRNSTIFSN